MEYAEQIFLTPFIPLFFGVVMFFLRREGKISRGAWQLALIILPILFLLAVLNSLAGMRAVDGFRRLGPEQIREIVLIDESRDNYRCRPVNGAVASQCQELEITDARMLARLNATFPAARSYAPNHEGPRDRYLMRIDLREGGPIWVVLGRGTRRNPQTAWLGFNSNIDNGMHYGVYTSEPLYAVLAELRLKKWPAAKAR